MTEEIDWAMTIGTLLLATFVAWVVVAMYRPPVPQGRALEAWAQAAPAATVQEGEARPALPSTRQP
jgi:hypothetical protein